MEGPQAVAAALRAGAGLVELYTVDADDPMVQLAAAAGVEVVLVTEAVLAAIAQTVTPQGVVGVAPLLDVPLHEALRRPPRLVTVLHEVADPGNAGTVIRVSDAAGADAVVLTADSVDPHNGKCVRATAGSLWHLPVVSGARLEAVVGELHGHGLQVLATAGQGEDDLDDLADDGVLDHPTAWLFGNEAGGLPPAALALADRRVRIPMRGRAESLNVGTAAAVCLFASARAQRERP